jgi:hypothetical protein
LLSQFGKYANDVDRYIKINKLKVEDRYDLAKVISYYNSLFIR